MLRLGNVLSFLCWLLISSSAQAVDVAGENSYQARPLPDANAHWTMTSDEAVAFYRQCTSDWAVENQSVWRYQEGENTFDCAHRLRLELEGVGYGTRPASSAAFVSAIVANYARELLREIAAGPEENDTMPDARRAATRGIVEAETEFTAKLCALAYRAWGAGTGAGIFAADCETWQADRWMENLVRIRNAVR